MNTKALYPLSGDPIHKGHIYNIETALDMFDEVHVILGTNGSKKYLFDMSERLYLTEKSIDMYIKDEKDRKRVTLGTLEGLLSTYALINGYTHVIRGARNTKDFEYEQSIAELFAEYGIQTTIFPSDKKLQMVSSTLMKELSRYGGFVNEYVTPIVKQALEERIAERSLIGVTGSMGSGKSTFCKELVEYSKEHSTLNITHLDIDKMVHSIYSGKEELYVETRKKIEETFGEKLFDENGINRKRAAELLFKNHDLEKKLSDILKVPFMAKLETELRDKKGIILIDAAYLVEKNMMPLVNNNIILVTCDEKTRIERIRKRDNMAAKEVECWTELQMKPDSRKEKILAKQHEDDYGFFYEYVSSDTDKEKKYEQVITALQENFPLKMPKKR